MILKAHPAAHAPCTFNLGRIYFAERYAVFSVGERGTMYLASMEKLFISTPKFDPQAWTCKHSKISAQEPGPHRLWRRWPFCSSNHRTDHANSKSSSDRCIGRWGGICTSVMLPSVCPCQAPCPDTLQGERYSTQVEKLTPQDSKLSGCCAVAVPSIPDKRHTARMLMHPWISTPASTLCWSDGWMLSTLASLSTAMNHWYVWPSIQTLMSWTWSRSLGRNAMCSTPCSIKLVQIPHCTRR